MIVSTDLTGFHRRILVVQHHMVAVLRKYPRETIPADLLWAQYRLESWTFAGGDSVEVRTWFGEHKGTIPLKLLDAPEQDIRAWTRQTYWVGRERAAQEAANEAHREIERLRAEARRAEQAVKEAQRRYDHAAALRDRVESQRAARWRAKVAKIGATR